jgi:hypothetical protein
LRLARREVDRCFNGRFWRWHELARELDVDQLLRDVAIRVPVVAGIERSNCQYLRIKIHGGLVQFSQIGLLQARWSLMSMMVTRRFRKRGIIIGIATVLAAVVAVLQWLDWPPGRPVRRYWRQLDSHLYQY